MVDWPMFNETKLIEQCQDFKEFEKKVLPMSQVRSDIHPCSYPHQLSETEILTLMCTLSGEAIFILALSILQVLRVRN